MRYDVSSGVTRNGIVLNGGFGEDDCFMIVSSGGTANNTTVDNCASMYVSRGGVANNTTVTGSGRVYVSGHYEYGEYVSGYYEYVEGGSMFVSSGGTANNTTVNGYGRMYVSGGVANNTTIYGYMDISSGGTANGVTVKDGSYLSVESGGTATNIYWIPGLGGLDWENADYISFANDISGVFYTRGCEGTGNPYEETPSVSGSGYLVSSGPVLSSIRVTTKRDGNKRWVDEMNVMSGGTAVDITVDDDAFLFVNSGGTVVNLSIDYGAWGGVASGAKLTGRVTILYDMEDLEEFGLSPSRLNFFSVSDEATFDFDLTRTWAGASPLVNYLVAFSDYFSYYYDDDYQDSGFRHYCGNYTLTVAGNQANGNYNLAGGASGFEETITVVDKNSGAFLGELNVGETVTINGKAYTLNLSGDNLTVTIGAVVVDTTAPQISLISGSPTTSTTGTVTVTATFTDNVGVTATYYRLGENGAWRTYSNDVTVSDNTTVSFKAVDAAGNESNVYSYIVSNIVKPKPAQPTASADITATTRQSVTVTASFGSDSAQRQYSLDGQNWSTYTSGIRFAQNGTVYFRGVSSAGIVSDVTSYTVSNIDLVAPEISLISGSPTTATDRVTVSAFFTDNTGVVATYYKLGENGAWRSCSGSVTVTENTIVSFKAVDAAGNESNVYSYIVNNIVTNLSSGLVLYSESRIVSTGEFYLNTTLNDYSRLYVSSGGTANNTTIYYSYLYVSNGGTANSTVVFGGELNVSSGGTAIGTTVDYWGCLNVSNGGTANNTVMFGGGSMSVSSGGTATGTTVNSNGFLYVSSGGTANNTTVNSSGFLEVSSGGTANDTTVNSSGFLYVSSGGAANDTTVNSNGFLEVSSGGTANSPTVDSGGHMSVTSGGTATNIDWTPCAGIVWIEDGAYATFVSRYSGVYYGSENMLLSHATVMESRTISGFQCSMYVMSGGTATGTTVNSWGDFYVTSGGTATGTTVNSGGGMSVTSGGTANDTTVNSSGFLYVSSGGTATNIDWTPFAGFVRIADGAYATFVSRYSGVYYGSANRLLSNTAVMESKTLSGYQHSMYVMSGGTATGTTVNSGGDLYVSSGGTANNTTINSCGWISISSGGMATGTTVNSGGRLNVYRGGRLTGQTTISSGACISASSGAILDFDISTLAPGALVRINDMSMISGWKDALFTLTVGGSQTNGTYSLAENASGFDKTISVVNASGAQLGTLAVGQTASIGGVDYTLKLNDGSLTVSIASASTEPVVPEKLPIFTGDFIGNGKSLLAVKDEPVIRIYRSKGSVLSELTLDDGWDVAGVGDFNGDGADDILRVHGSGLVIGEMSSGDGDFSSQVLNYRNEGWSILGTGDFDGSGTDDVLIANPTGASSTVGLLGYWESGVTWTLINGYSAEWECVATGDFNGDGKCDMLWKNSFVGDGGLTYNAYCTWIVDPPAGQSDWRMVSVANPDEWNFLCTGDFNGDKMNDIAMINGEGVVGIWGVSDGYLSSWSILSAVDPSSWALAGVGDFNGDGTDDIAWRNTSTGLTGYWQINDKALTAWTNIAALQAAP